MVFIVKVDFLLRPWQNYMETQTWKNAGIRNAKDSISEILELEMHKKFMITRPAENANHAEKCCMTV